MTATKAKDMESLKNDDYEVALEVKTRIGKMIITSWLFLLNPARSNCQGQQWSSLPHFYDLLVFLAY